MNKLVAIYHKHYPIIISVIILIFLYILFYTDYIIDNTNCGNTSKSLLQNPTQENQPIQQITSKLRADINQELSDSRNINININKHVHFEPSKNQEIEYEIDNGSSIDYNSPNLNELQRISQCTYPMNTPNQINKRDCALDGSCLVSFQPQSWFKEQRTVKYDLPGYNGFNQANFSFDENIQQDKMMRNKPIQLDELYNTPSPITNINTGTEGDIVSENFNGYNSNIHQPVDHPTQILYNNAPFNGLAGGVELRGSLPSDICRNCTTGVCNGDVCGIKIFSPNKPLNYNLP
jgi:hypothetical protein